MGVAAMPTAIQPSAILRARRLRRDMTDGERRLWAELRQFRHWYGLHVRRQAPVGNYVADFLIHERKLVIEVDGEYHFEPERQERDRRRDEWFLDQGYRVLRFNTGELSEAFDGCVEEILSALGLMKPGAVPPPLTPPHKGEGNSETSTRASHKEGSQTVTTPSLWGGVRGGGAAP